MEFYYQIKGKKGKDQESFNNWVFPPIFSGKVTAENKKKAKEIIYDQYDQIFPLKVLNKDIDKHEFLLSIEEIKEDSHISRLFEPQACIRCKKTFYVIDKYNDHNEKNKGFSYCSSICDELDKQFSQAIKNDYELVYGGNKPLIYKITNKVTNKIYVGKTSQVFTLRWYQHFFQTGTNKFHDAIKASTLKDWQFEILEIVEFPQEIKESREFKLLEEYVFERERWWINHFNSIIEGYNSI
jgi:hypothetical protein